MSDRKRILIVGGSGFVGTNLAKDLSLSSHFSVACTYHQGVTRLPGVEYYPFSAIADREACKNLVQTIEPAHVIYAIGSNDQNWNETHARESQYHHSGGATTFQTAAESVKAKFIYISSDAVFSGHGGNYAEDDLTIPGNTLGKAKVATENHIRGRSLNYLIIRSAPLMGRGALDHPSWVDRIREKHLLGQKIVLSQKLIRNPVHISFLSELILKALDRELKNQILHLSGIVKISEYALGERILTALGLGTENLSETDASSEAEQIDYSLNASETLRLLSNESIKLDESLKRLVEIR